MKRLVALIISLILLLTSVGIYIYVRYDATLHTSFGKDYAIIRVFDSDGMTMSEISTLRYAAEDASTADPDDTGRLWCDAYSYFTDVYASLPDKTGIECAAIVTGGDFFLFHDIKFKSGWYYNDTDTHLDRVVIDERLAFELYGSNHADDMKLTLGGKTFYVAGVAELDEKKAKELQLGEKPLIYIPQYIAEPMFGERAFDSYELMMQDPVNSYAYNAISAAATDKTVIDVTSRFDIFNILKLYREFPTRSYRNESVTYPYWENYDRGIEDTLLVLMTVNIILGVIFITNTFLFISERKKR